MTLILGLGNPGKQYEKSRHNVGFSVIDSLAKKLGVKTTSIKGKPYESVETFVGREKVCLCKPLTYMNASGDIFPYFINKNVTNVIVSVDNMDLDVGKVRLKRGGSSAGHNGLKSIISHYGDDFYRVYIGVGRPQGDVNSHVLGALSKDDREKVEHIVDKVADVLITFVQDFDIAKAQYDLSL